MKIVTDSAVDMPADEAAVLGITVAPLFINFPEGEISSAALSPDEFFDRLEAMAPRVPTTSQPSPGYFLDVFNTLLRTGDEIMAIHISSGLSGTVQSSRLAASQLPGQPITVIDSLSLSCGQRFQVLAASAAAKAGWTRGRIVELLQQIQQHCEVIFTLDTLDYLARGGRIGRVQAIAGTLLHLKPVINVHKGDGKYSTPGKARTLHRAQEMIVDHLAQLYGDQSVWVTVMHGRFAPQAEFLSTALRKKLNVAKLEVLRVSPVLSVHTGPGVVGAAVLPMSLVAGLAM